MRQNIEKVQKFFGRQEWMDNAEIDLENKKLEQIEKDAEFFWRCRKVEYQKAKTALANGSRNNFIDADGLTGIHLSAHLSAGYGKKSLEVLDIIWKQVRLIL